MKMCRSILRRFPPFSILLFLPGLLSGAPGWVLDVGICAIQGSGFSSPYAGQAVQTRGVVTLDLDEEAAEGFFLQDQGCDGDSATSDGIFVYLGQAVDLTSVGDHVEVQGWVVEYGGLTEVSVQPSDVVLLGVRPLPVPVVFSPPWGAQVSRLFFEAHEAMRIAVDDAVVVGSTTARGETFIVDSQQGVSRVFEGQAAGAIIALGSDGPSIVSPGAAVGDHLLAVEGVLDVQAGDYSVQLTSTPGRVRRRPVRPFRAAPGDITFATLNLHNLFDTFDDPTTQDSVLTASQYQARLAKIAGAISADLGEPDFIALQEAENGAVLQALANRPELTVQYGYEWFDGPDIRGIDVALFYRPDRVTVLSSQQHQGCTSLVDGLGPDGNLDPVNPSNALTCDLDGQPGMDGNRLFSRPPLAVQLLDCGAGCGGNQTLWVIIVHLKSKSQDTPQAAYTLPRRLEQAVFLEGLAADILQSDPQAAIVLLGDFNDTLSSLPLAALSASGLVNLVQGAPQAARYTYNYRGISQVLDHVFTGQALLGNPFSMLFANPVPIGSDFPADLEYVTGTSLRVSDHDPILVRTLTLSEEIFLPIISRGP